MHWNNTSFYVCVCVQNGGFFLSLIWVWWALIQDEAVSYCLYCLQSVIFCLLCDETTNRWVAHTRHACLCVCLYVLFFNHFFVLLHQYEFGGVDYTHAHNFSVLKHALKKIHSLHTMMLSRRVILFIIFYVIKNYSFLPIGPNWNDI